MWFFFQRGDLIDVSQHEAALNKLRQEMAAEQVAAVAEGTARERRRLEVELDRERARLTRQEAAKQVAFNEALKRVAQDKDRQLESLREESEQLRTTVERLSQAQAAAERDLGEQRDTIRRLQQYHQHQQQRSSRHRHVSGHDAMSTSVAVLV
jgi:chromosome segregation ATPase